MAEEISSRVSQAVREPLFSAQFEEVMSLRATSSVPELKELELRLGKRRRFWHLVEQVAMLIVLAVVFTWHILFNEVRFGDPLLYMAAFLAVIVGCAIASRLRIKAQNEMNAVTKAIALDYRAADMVRAIEKAVGRNLGGVG